MLLRDILPWSTARLLLGPPGLPSRTYAGWEALHAHPWAPPDAAQRAAYAQRTLDDFAASIDRLPRNRTWAEQLDEARRRLQQGDWGVHLVRDVPLHVRATSLPDRTLATWGPAPQPPGSPAVELRGDPHDEFRAWLVERLQRSEDIGPLVASTIAGSWAGELVDPEDLYLAVLARYFAFALGAMDLEVEDNPVVEQLLEFQQEAYHFARGVLQRFGGVLLADVVGLGKTWIAIALLHHLHHRYDRDAVIVAPPAVLPAWQELLDQWRIPAGLVSLGKLSDLERYVDREVLVLDESHHLRNTDTQRYDTLQQWLRTPPGGRMADSAMGLRTRQVILLSATPQNNDPSDVLNQLKLFPETWSPLPHQGESLDEWFRSHSENPAELRRLLQYVVVRRTRGFIRKAFPDARIRVRTADGDFETRPLRFPRRISGLDQCLRYRVAADIQGERFFDRLITTLAAMQHPSHGQGLYLLADARKDKRLQGLARAGPSIRGLYRMLLLKRLESSIHAFRLSLDRLHRRLASFRAGLRAGRVLTGDALDEALANNGTGHRHRGHPLDLFDARQLLEDTEADLRRIRDVLTDLDRISGHDDRKLDRLGRWLDMRPPSRHRTIVFTQFRDTASWLAERLRARWSGVALVTGST
ncbi:MAG: hypothetical protein D6798_02675, partial [Deltaproteobacteria bacterium]